MSTPKCPGQDSMFLKPDDIAEEGCPNCGQAVEFWPDELMRKCPECGHRFPNPSLDLKCLEWCEYADQCLSSLRRGRGIGPLREELVGRMKNTFQEESRVTHTLEVTELAERIGVQLGAEPLVLVPAAILHDIGRARPEAEDHGVSGRELAAEMLGDLGLPGAVRDRILELIEHHHERDRMDSAEGAALFDADLLVNLRGREDALETLKEQALSEPGRRIGTDRFGS